MNQHASQVHPITSLQEPTHRCRGVAVDADAVEGSVRLLAQELPHLLARDLERGRHGGQRTGNRGRGAAERVWGTHEAGIGGWRRMKRAGVGGGHEANRRVTQPRATKSKED